MNDQHICPPAEPTGSDHHHCDVCQRFIERMGMFGATRVMIAEPLFTQLVNERKRCNDDEEQ